MSKSTVTTNCLLSCGCHRILAGQITLGASVNCTEHGPVLVRSSLPEYRVRCQNCRYARKWGQARLTALTKASSHALRNNHRVDVWHGERHVETTGRGYRQPTLPEINDPVLRRSI